MKGRANDATELLFLVGFRVYGFFLIYLRDFATGKEQWIADYAVGKYFESRWLGMFVWRLDLTQGRP